MALSYKIKIDVLITDDNKIYHDGLAPLLQSFEFIETIRHAYNGKEALAVMAEHRCRLVLMDYRMPVMDGAACTRHIKKRYPEVKVIALSLYDDKKAVLEMVKSGADAYLLKNTSGEEIETAIEKVFTGRHYFTPDISQFVIDTAIDTIQAGDAPFSEKEMEILRLMWAGKTNKEISDETGISERTVERHRQSMYNKCGKKTVVGLIRYALTNRILQLDEE